MQIICSIYTNEQLNNLSKNLDLALLMHESVSLNYKDLDLDKAIDYCKFNNIKSVIALDKMYEPKDLDFISSFIDKYKDICDYFYVTDIGIANICIKKNIPNKIIYDPKTMICNSLDLIEFNKFNFNALGISSEITKNDLLTIYNKTKAPIFYQIFGYRMMFYSKRLLISLYENKNQGNYPKDGYLKEATRNDYFPIFENKNGVVIYRPYVISYMDYLSEIKELKYGFLESYLIDDSKMNIILETFKNLLNDKLDINTARLNILKLDLKIEDGFMFKDSVYEKKELKL